MKKDPSIFLGHIVESIEEVQNHTKGLSKKDFLESILVQDAVFRRLEIIGEAVRNIPAPLRKKYKDIPWEKIAGTRNILIHEYFGVDLDLVWLVVKKELPVLKRNIKKILEKL